MLQEVHQLEDTTLQIHDMRDIYTASRTGEIAKVTNYGGKQRHYSMQAGSQNGFVAERVAGATLPRHAAGQVP